MSEALQQLLDILELEKIDETIYRGVTPETTNKRVFGGQVFAQAMRAAQDTVPNDRMVHSQHAQRMQQPTRHLQQPSQRKQQST